jgi:prophage tail gpP-like protein
MSLSIEINGNRYRDWDSSRIFTSIYALADAFAVSGRLRFGDFQVKAGDSCRVYVGDELSLTGYVDMVKPSISDTITISGRSNTCDLVDSQLPGETTFINIKSTDIITAICAQFDIETEIASVDAPVIETFVVSQDETAADAILRIGADYGYTITSTPEGKLKVVDGESFTYTGIVFNEGQNISQGTLTASDSSRYNEYQAIGQRYAQTQTLGTQIGTSTRTRIRRKIIDGEVSNSICQTSAERMAGWLEGQAVKVELEPTQSSFVPAASIVSLNSDTLGIEGKMIVESLELNIGTGSKVNMVLVSPEAYGGDPVQCRWLK